jgi:hypothetical protein
MPITRLREFHGFMPESDEVTRIQPMVQTRWLWNLEEICGKYPQSGAVMAQLEH